MPATQSTVLEKATTRSPPSMNAASMPRAINVKKSAHAQHSYFPRNTKLRYVAVHWLRAENHRVFSSLGTSRNLSSLVELAIIAPTSANTHDNGIGIVRRSYRRSRAIPRSSAVVEHLPYCNLLLVRNCRTSHERFIMPRFVKEACVAIGCIQGRGSQIVFLCECKSLKFSRPCLGRAIRLVLQTVYGANQSR